MSILTGPPVEKSWSDILIKARTKSRVQGFGGGKSLIASFVYNGDDNAEMSLDISIRYYNLPIGDLLGDGCCYVTCGDYTFEVDDVFTFTVRYFSEIMTGNVNHIHAKTVNHILNFDNPVHGCVTVPDRVLAIDNAEHHLMLIAMAVAE